MMAVPSPQFFCFLLITALSFTSGGDVTCDFDTDLCGYQQSSNDDGDWIRYKGSAPTKNTGPASDHTTGSGYYIYMESSNPAKDGDVFDIYSPVYKLAGDICVSFWYSMYGEHVNNLFVYAITQQSLSPAQMWKQSANQGKDWLKGEFKLPQQSSAFRLMFRAERGKDIRGDIAIDDIRLHECGALAPSTAPNPNAIVCNFDTDDCGFLQSTDDDGDWIRNRGSVPTRNTGPSSDHTTGLGYYMFMESSNPARDGDEFDLYSPVYNINGDVCVTFWYSMYGEHVKELLVYSTGQNKESAVERWKMSDEQGKNWKMGELKLLQQTSPFRLRFRAVRGKDIRGDIAVDDITVSPCGTPDSPVTTAAPGNPIDITTIPAGDDNLKKRVDITAYYVILCDELTDDVMALLQSTAETRYQEIEGLCSECRRSSTSGITISCSRDVTSVTWPTDLLLPSYVTSVPAELLAEITNQLTSSDSLLQMNVLTKVPPIIFPLKNTNGLPVEVNLFPICSDGSEYEDLSNSCV